MNETNVQRNFKDTVFRMLCREKENLLGLYNALNGTSYTDVGNLEITTLEPGTAEKNQRRKSVQQEACQDSRTQICGVL